RLPHPPAEEGLADAVVDLVRPGVVEVLALEVDARPAELARQVLGEPEPRRPADVVAEEPLELGDERRVGPRLVPRPGQLVERGEQRLGHVAAAVGPESSGKGHVVSLAAATKRRSLSLSLCPGAASTPLQTSTPNGCTARTAAPTFSG